MSDAKSNGSQLAVPHVLLLIMLGSDSLPLELYRAQVIYSIIYYFIVCLVSFLSHFCSFFSDSDTFLAFFFFKSQLVAVFRV